MTPPVFRPIVEMEPSFAFLLRFSLFDVFVAYDHARTYVPPLWTMGVELIGSMIVLGLLLAVGRRRDRWLAYAALGIGFFVAGSAYALFIAGIVLAELFHERRGVPLGAALTAAAAASGMLPQFLDGQDVRVAMLSTILVCIALMFATPLRAALSGRFSRWLGRISFPLYLVHAPIIVAVGVPLMPYAEGSDVLALAIGCGVAALSIVAAVAAVPINTFAIDLARRAGHAAGALFERRPSSAADAGPTN